MSASAAATRQAATAAGAATGLLRDDVFKGSPGNDRKNGVVEAQESEEAAGVVADAGADAAHERGDHEREEEQRQHELARPARGGRGGGARPRRRDAQTGRPHAG